MLLQLQNVALKCINLTIIESVELACLFVGKLWKFWWNLVGPTVQSRTELINLHKYLNTQCFNYFCLASEGFDQTHRDLVQAAQTLQHEKALKRVQHFQDLIFTPVPVTISLIVKFYLCQQHASFRCKKINMVLILF